MQLGVVGDGGVDLDVLLLAGLGAELHVQLV